MGERTRLAGAALLRMDPALASRALADPDSLTELELTKLNFISDADDPWTKELMQQATDPWNAVALLLCARFPIAPAGKMFQYAKKLTGPMVADIPIIGRLRSFLPMFRGTELEKLYPEAVNAKRIKLVDWSGDAADALKKWEKKVGRSITTDDEILLYADDVNNWMETTGIRGRLKMPEYLRPLHDDLQRVMTRAHAETTTGGHFAKVADDLARNGYDVDPRAVKRYAPRRKIRDIDDLTRDAEEHMEAIYGTSPEDVARLNARVKRQMSSNLKSRKNSLVPDTDDLRRVEQHFNDPNALRAIENFADDHPTMGRYSLRMVSKSLPDYLHRMSATNALTTQGYGQRVVDATERLRKMDAPSAKTLARMMDQTYTRLLKGEMTVGQANWAGSWASVKHSAVTSIDNMLESNLGKSGAMKTMLGGIKKSLLAEEGALAHAGSKLTGLMTVGALGGNISSALQNLSSTVLLSTQIGPTAALKGVQSVAKKGSKYFRLRQQKGEWAAWKESFPEFSKSGLVSDPLSSEVREMLDGAYQGSMRLGAKGAYQKFQKVIMAPFTAGEVGQRLVAFEGAHWKAVRDGLKGRDVTDFATRMVYESQFTAGPVSSPYMFLNVPAPMRHLMSYGTRFVEQLGASTAWATGGGQGLSKAWGPLAGRNLGNLGRLMLATSVIEGAGQMAGQDWERFGFAGSIPFRNYGAFAPLPVPPIGQLLGAGIMDISHGELKELKRSLPLFVPGGAAASRAIGMVSPKAAMALDKEYTDWQPDAQGKYTLFDYQGRSRGQLSAFQLTLRAAGLPVGDLDKEQQARRVILAQRDRIKEMRKEYLRLSITGDHGSASKIAEDFEQAFGYKLDVRPQDWDAARMHMRMARNESLLGTMPKEVRPQIQRLLQLDAVNSAYHLQKQGVDPHLISPSHFWSQPQTPQGWAPLGFQPQGGRPRTSGQQRGQFELSDTFALP